MQIFPIPFDVSGTLAIMPKPESALPQAMHTLRGYPVDHLVSLLTPPEIIRAGLQREQEFFQQAGGQFHAHPIADRGIPDDAAAFVALASTLYAHVSAGETVVAHCWGGIGRSGLLACSIMCCHGLEPAAAIELATTTRGLRSPETDAQHNFLLTEFSR